MVVSVVLARILRGIIKPDVCTWPLGLAVSLAVALNEETNPFEVEEEVGGAWWAGLEE